MDKPPRPRSMPRPTLPNPGIAENGAVPCNAPLDGAPGVFCDRWVKRNRDGTSKGHKRHPHRFTWTDRG